MQKIQELIDDILATQKNNLFLWTPFLFSLGIAIYFGLKFEPPFIAGLAGFIFAITLTIQSFITRDHNSMFALWSLMTIAIALIMAGFCVAQWRTISVHTPMIIKKMNMVEVSGNVNKIEFMSDKDGSRITLKNLKIERIKLEDTPRKIRLTVRQDDNLRRGQRVKLLASLNPPGTPVTPNGFDFQRMMYFQGIGAVGFVYKKPEILTPNDASNKGLGVIRNKLIQSIKTHTQNQEQAIITALMTGQRGAISDSNWDALRQSGLAHLLAISGLHVGMVAGVLFFFSRLFMACFPPLALHYPIKKWAAGIALVGAAFYTILVGAPIPTQRALIMTGLMMIAIMFDRSPFSMRLVALAALLVLFFSPESLTSVSFQMSFAAVVALIYFYELIRPYWRTIHSQAGSIRQLALYFVGISLTTLVAGAATGIFSLYHFQNFANYGLLANLVAVPFMAFVIMPLLVLCTILIPLGLAGFVFPLVEWGVSWVLATAHWVSGLNGAVWHISTFPHWIFIIVVCTSWFWIIWRERFKVIVVPILIFMLWLSAFYKQPDILISSKADLVAVRGNDGTLWLSTKRKERYSADQWMRANGKTGQDKLSWPKEGGAPNFPLICDSYGCRGKINGYNIAVAFSQEAWQEDCAWADIVISQTPVPYKECQTRHVNDFFDVWRNGAHAVWLTSDKVKIKTVEGQRGKRPWAQIPPNKFK